MFELIGELYTQYQSVLFWLGIASVIFFLFSIATLPWLVGLIPVDYFKTHHEIHWHHMLRPRSIVRNLIGLTLIAAGILMIVLPGQGILTIMLGLSAMIFPGKFQLERWVVRRQGILHALNWIRKRRNIPPLEV